MPAILENPRVANTFLTAVEAAQFALHASVIGRPLVKKMVGLDTPAYLQSLWRGYPAINPDEIDFCEVPANPLAKYMRPKTWQRVAVLGALASEAGHVHDEYPDSQEAVAYEFNGIVRVGRLPKPGFGYINATGQVIVGMRPGPDILKAKMGRFDKHNKLFLPYHSTEVLQRDVSTAHFNSSFYGPYNGRIT